MNSYTMDVEDLKCQVSFLIQQVKVNQLDKIMRWLGECVVEYQKSGYNVLNTFDSEIKSKDGLHLSNCLDNKPVNFTCRCGRIFLTELCFSEVSGPRLLNALNGDKNPGNFDELETHRILPNLISKREINNRLDEGNVLKRRRVEDVIKQKFGSLANKDTSTDVNVVCFEENEMMDDCERRSSDSVLNNSIIGRHAADQLKNMNCVDRKEFVGVYADDADVDKKDSENEWKNHRIPLSVRYSVNENAFAGQDFFECSYCSQKFDNAIQGKEHVQTCSWYSTEEKPKFDGKGNLYQFSPAVWNIQFSDRKIRKSKYLSTYLTAWETEFNKEVKWLKRGLTDGHAYCSICSREILIKHMGKSAIIQHMKGRVHRNRFENILSSGVLSDYARSDGHVVSSEDCLNENVSASSLNTVPSGNAPPPLTDEDISADCTIETQCCTVENNNNDSSKTIVNILNGKNSC